MILAIALWESNLRAKFDETFGGPGTLTATLRRIDSVCKWINPQQARAKYSRLWHSNDTFTEWNDSHTWPRTPLISRDFTLTEIVSLIQIEIMKKWGERAWRHRSTKNSNYVQRAELWGLMHSTTAAVYLWVQNAFLRSTYAITNSTDLDLLGVS
jgi:hypothetical protein